MSFVPIVPTGGLAGLRFVERTYERQLENFSRNPEIRRDIDHFLDTAGAVDSVADLMADPRILRVVLGAFGLEDDLPKRAFIRKVIEEGTLTPRAFANRMAEPAYREMAAELGFGDFGGRLGLGSVRESIAERYRVRRFESAVGEQDVDLRLALNFRREIARIAEGAATSGAGWFRVLGSRPLRAVVEAAFGLPERFAALDIDQQRSELESIARRRFGEGSVAVFRDPAAVETTIRRFLAVSQARETLAGGPGSAALQLIRATSLGAGAQAGLFRSNLR